MLNNLRLLKSIYRINYCIMGNFRWGDRFAFLLDTSKEEQRFVQGHYILSICLLILDKFCILYCISYICDQNFHNNQSNMRVHKYQCLNLKNFHHYSLSKMFPMHRSKFFFFFKVKNFNILFNFFKSKIPAKRVTR